MLTTTRYTRKPFFIDGVRVTDENYDEVAARCEGTLNTEGEGVKFVKVKVHRPLNDRQTKAYSGDWVLKAGNGYKVYTNKAFTNSFVEADPVEAGSDAKTPPVVSITAS